MLIVNDDCFNALRLVYGTCSMLYGCPECFIIMVVCNECSISCCCYVRNALCSMCVQSDSFSWLYAMNALCLVFAMSGMLYTLCVSRMLHSHGCMQ